MKNSNKTIGNRTRDLPACSAVPHLTALRRAPLVTTTRMLHLTIHSNISHPLPEFQFRFFLSKPYTHFGAMAQPKQRRQKINLTATDIQTVTELLYKDENSPDLGYDGQAVWEDQSEM